MNKKNIKELWWLTINKITPINYDLYRLYEDFYLKIFVYPLKGKKPIILTIDLNDKDFIKNLKKNEEYNKIINIINTDISEKFKQKELEEFNSIIDFIINNF